MSACALLLLAALQADPKDYLDPKSDHTAVFRALCDQGDKATAELDRAAGDPALRWWVESVREELRARRERPSVWNPKPVSLSFTNAPLAKVLDKLDVKASGKQAEKLISLELKEATSHEAFREALGAAGLEGFFFLSGRRRSEASLMLTEKHHEPLAAFRSPHYDAEIRGAAEVLHVDFKGPAQHLLRGRGERMESAPAPKEGSDRESVRYYTLSSLQVQLEAYVRLSKGLPDRLSLVRGHAVILSCEGSEKLTLSGILKNPKQSAETPEARVTVTLDDVDPEWVLTVEIEPRNPEWKGLGLGGDSGDIALVDGLGRKLQGGGSDSQGHHTYHFTITKSADRIPETVHVPVRSGIFARKAFFEFRDLRIQ
ncbi:MAG: hypothetical protein HY293_02030 [Planctomycetes bacterium]|nr:hypothetical protein [Planctomycetota bacterium]